MKIGPLLVYVCTSMREDVTYIYMYLQESAGRERRVQYRDTFSLPCISWLASHMRPKRVQDSCRPTEHLPTYVPWHVPPRHAGSVRKYFKFEISACLCRLDLHIYIVQVWMSVLRSSLTICGRFGSFRS